MLKLKFKFFFLKKKRKTGVFGYENKEKHPICVSKKWCKEKHADLLLIGEEGKIHYVLNKGFNTFFYDHTLHCKWKDFCYYYLQAFST